MKSNPNIISKKSNLNNTKERIKEEFWECDRCKENNWEDPEFWGCPRGGCDVEKKGEITITRELKLTKK